MRRVNIGQGPQTVAMLSPEMRWLSNALSEIERASAENDQRVIAQAYTITNITPTRVLDGSTAGLTELVNFIGTLVLDLRAGEVRKS